MRSRLRPCVLGLALVLTLTVPVTAGTASDADLLAQMAQKVQKLEQQVHAATSQCQAGQRPACEQGAERLERLARMQRLLEGCQQDDRESCTDLRVE
jgi:hypothetical protein